MSIFARKKLVLSDDAYLIAYAVRETYMVGKNLISRDLLVDEFVRLLKMKDDRFDEARFRSICTGGALLQMVKGGK